MEIIDLISGLFLALVLFVGFGLKRKTRRALEDIDGLGEVKRGADADSDGITF